MSDLQPLRFTPLLLPKVWGGDRLRCYGKDVREGDRIGESWEIADLSATSPSGGGGDAKQSVVAEGPFAGRTIRDVLGELGESFLGSTRLHDDGSFPLLVKFLDAREDLSVQVHPSREYAATHPEAHLKSETWVVLDAEPGSRIYAGLREGVTPDDFERAIHEGGVPERMHQFEAEPGMVVDLPSGIVHALGAGVMVAEVQTASDTTFRVYDWGRTDREIHIEQAMACIRDAAALTPRVLAHDSGGEIGNEHYSIRSFGCPRGSTRPLRGLSECSVLMVTSGDGTLELSGCSLPLFCGQTLLLASGTEGVIRAAHERLVCVLARVG
ncbi:MAG: type I phosphomannose isomerase catalytic subunit [Planctomycetota bacterium]|jgi:mannose-6-phosphate isomerase